MQCLVFLGPPGVGKGTQAKIYAESQGLAHISTGDMLRNAVKSGSELGARVSKIIDAGQLVPDELMIELIDARIGEADCSSGYILDGFPRTIPQAQALANLIAKHGATIRAAVLFDLADHEIMARLTNRREQENRADDNEEVQRRRLEVYRTQTAPLIDYYQQENLLLRIPADGEISQVQELLTRELNS